MACRFAAEHLTDALEGKLEGGRAAYFRFHMTICPYCKAYRDQVSAVSKAAAELGARGEESANEVSPKLLEAFRAKTKRADE